MLARSHAKPTVRIGLAMHSPLITTWRNVDGTVLPYRPPGIVRRSQDQVGRRRLSHGMQSTTHYNRDDNDPLERLHELPSCCLYHTSIRDPFASGRLRSSESYNSLITVQLRFVSDDCADRMASSERLWRFKQMMWKTTSSTFNSHARGFPVKIGWLRIEMSVWLLLDCPPYDRDAILLPSLPRSVPG